MPKTLVRLTALLLVLGLIAASCGNDDDGDATDGTDGDTTEEPSDDIDYEALGLWDDGECDPALEPLVLGLITTFETPVISLGDQAIALEAAAEAFNARGGANGACIEVHTCDDQANLDRAVQCVRDLDDAGVVATVNDQNTAGAAEVSAGLAEAGIPRVAGNVTNNDWGDQNAYPIDASGTGSTFLMPQALIEADVTDIAIIRLDSPAAGALIGLLDSMFAPRGATFPADIPVPGGTTDFSQFILAAQDAGATGAMLALGEQEAVQVVRAGQQLGTDVMFGTTLGTFSHSAVAQFDDFAEQMVFTWSYPPATADVPVYEVLRADLSASGEEALQPENLKASPMRSWIGLYALLWMIREDGMTEFSRDGIKAMLEAQQSVPMLDIFGGEDWTPDRDHPGIYQRAGVNRWTVWSWDPDAEFEGSEGNFSLVGEISFDEVMCGSPFGAPADTC